MIDKTRALKNIQNRMLSFFSSLFFILVFVLSLSESLSAQRGGTSAQGGGIPDFSWEGFYEYPIVPNFFTMIYGVGADFNFTGIREVNILNSVRFKHRISSTDDYFPDNVYGVSYRITMINERILIQNIVSSNSTKPFQSIHDISNLFVAGYNFLNSETMALYIGLMVIKPMPFLGRDFDGIPLPFAFFVYTADKFSVRVLPLDLNWSPNQLLEIQVAAFFSYVRFNTFFHITDFIYMGPEIEYNMESMQDADRKNKDEFIQLTNLQVGGRFHIYYFNIFLGYSFFNNYSIRTRGKSGAGNTVEPCGGFDFDVGYRLEF